MIPHRLIRCVPQLPPDWAEANWERWQDLNPGWEFVTIADPIDPTWFPVLGHLHRYATSGAQLAGMVRLEEVWTSGGVYCDMDMEPLRPLARLLERVDAGQAFIGTEDGVHLTDAMFGAPAAHPGLLLCMSRVLDLYHGHEHEGEALPSAQATGPLTTTVVLSGRPDVVVLPQPVLYPYSYLERHRRHEDFAATSPESIAVHHWAFSWEGT